MYIYIYIHTHWHLYSSCAASKTTRTPTPPPQGGGNYTHYLSIVITCIVTFMLLRCALFVVRELILLLLRSLWFMYMKWHTCCWAHPPISIQLCQRSLRTDKNGKNLLNVKPGDCLISTQTSHGCRETNRHRVAVEARVYRATGRCWLDLLAVGWAPFWCQSNHIF